MSGLKNMDQEETNEMDSIDQLEKTQNDIELLDQLELMKRMGLPTSFSSNSKQRNSKRPQIKNTPSEATKRQKQLSLKRKNQIKTFKKRSYGLFSKWSLIKKEGVEIDEEMYFSITPEEYAQKIAIYCKERVDYTMLIDGFCGVGGNLIQFAVENKNAFIIGVDLCPVRIEHAKKIAKIYNVENQCDFICGDYLKVAASIRMKPDIIFLSPPWGGCNYKKKTTFLLKDLLTDGNDAFRISKSLTSNIAFYLPRNQCINDLDRLKEDYSLKFNYSHQFGTTLNVYFGDLIDPYYERPAACVDPHNLSLYNRPIYNSTNQMPSSIFLGNKISIENLQFSQKTIKGDELTNGSSVHDDLVDLKQNFDVNLIDRNNNGNLQNNRKIEFDNWKRFIFQTLEDKKCDLM